MPVTLTETVKEPAAVKTWPVPVTPLPFSEIIVKGIEGDGLGKLPEPPPPHAVMTRKRAAADKPLCATCN